MEHIGTVFNILVVIFVVVVVAAGIMFNRADAQDDD